jgi:hypothetical protein
VTQGDDEPIEITVIFLYTFQSFKLHAGVKFISLFQHICGAVWEGVVLIGLSADALRDANPLVYNGAHITLGKGSCQHIQIRRVQVCIIDKQAALSATDKFKFMGRGIKMPRF